MLPDNEKRALMYLHDFYVLWQLSQWKQKMPNEGITHEDYQALVAKGLARQQSIPSEQIDSQLAKTDNPEYAKAMVELAKSMGMYDGNVWHQYQITDAGIDLWKSYQSPTSIERFKSGLT